MPSSDEFPSNRELQRCLNTLKRINSHHDCIVAPDAYWRSKQGRQDNTDFKHLRGAQRAVARMIHSHNLQPQLTKTSPC